VQLGIFEFDGIYYFVRWLHYIFGIIWIGHLYYFNFTQGEFLKETDAATKSNAIQKLVPRALWWFRWGAMFTFITGVIMLGMYGHRIPGIWETKWGVFILTGSALGTLMFLNVWLIIWPCQKVVIANEVAKASGQPAIPEAADKGARALVASRTNTLFSIPMLFFMGAASHLPLQIGLAPSYVGYTAAVAVILGLLELNAIKGKTGPMTTVKGVIHMGVALAVILYLVAEIMF